MNKVYSFLLLSISVLLLTASCLTYRSDFDVIGEQVIVEEDFSGGLYNWHIADYGHVGFEKPFYERVKEEERWIFKFAGAGALHLKDSTVESFRMEFDLRLDGFPRDEAEIRDACVHVHFRNYFDKTYILTIHQGDFIVLATEKVKHEEPKNLVRRDRKIQNKKWYHFEIVNVGANIKVFMNDVMIIDYTDKDNPIELGNIWFESFYKYSLANVKAYKIKDFIKIKQEKAKVVEEQQTPVVKEKMTVVVAEFENLGVQDYELSLIMDLYSDSLLETGAFRVTERKELDKVLEEQSLQFADFSDSENVVKISNIINTNYLTTGSCGRLGNEYVITLKIIQIETGETLASVTANFNNPATIPEELDSLTKDMADKVARL